MKENKGKYTKDPVKLQYVDKADGRKSIRLEVYLDGKRTYERLPDLFLLPETSESNVKKNKATINKAEKLRKHRLKEIQQQIKSEKESNIHPASVDEPQGTMLFDWIKRYCEIQKSRGIRSLADCKRLTRYLGLYNKNVPLVDIDKDYCLGFIDFLRNGYKTVKGEPLSPKSCFNILGEFSTCLNVAVQKDELLVNPMTLVPSCDKFKPIEQKREFLTVEELQKFIDTPCECSVVKNAFLFACYCGLRLGDIIALTWKDIIRDGTTTYVTTRMLKTERIIHIPLPKQALIWLPPKPTNALIDSKVFVGLYEKKVTSHMKQWVEATGITNKTVTFYCSRHTYATMLLTLGADIYTVSKLLGHTSIRHTQRYAQIVNKKKDDAISKLDNL